MIKKPTISSSFLLTVQQEKPIHDLGDKIASRAWCIDGVYTMAQHGAVTALEVMAQPFDSKSDTAAFADTLIGTGLWQMDPKQQDAAREALQRQLEAFLRRHGGTPVTAPAAVAFCPFETVGGRRVALKQYIAESAPAVGQKVMADARNEGFEGTLRERLKELGWAIEPILPTVRP